MTAAPQQTTQPAPSTTKATQYDTAEKSVLGRLLSLGIKQKANAAFDLVKDLTLTDFAQERHQLTWHAMRMIADRRENISLETVAAELNRPLKDGSKKAIEVVTEAYLYDLMATRSINLMDNAQLVREGALERKGLKMAQEMVKTFQDPSLHIKQKAVHAGALVKRISHQVQGLDGHPTKTLSASEMEYWNDLQAKRRALSAGDESSYGISTGYRAIDEVIHGFKRGNLYVVAARPAIGKSAFAINIALNAMRVGKSVLFIPLEMNDKDMTERVLAIESHVNTRDLETGNISPDDIARLEEAHARLQNYAGAQLFHYLQFETTPTLREIEVKLNHHMEVYGADLIIFDQMSREAIRSERPDANLDTFMSNTVMALRAWAVKNNAPLVAMAQLNRDSVKDPEQEPELKHLAGSDSVGRTADVVMALHRSSTQGAREAMPTKLLFLKQRKGMGGAHSIMLNYIPHITKFID
jgi:replicative DNA helicase